MLSAFSFPCSPHILCSRERWPSGILVFGIDLLFLTDLDVGKEANLSLQAAACNQSVRVRHKMERRKIKHEKMGHRSAPTTQMENLTQKNNTETGKKKHHAKNEQPDSSGVAGGQ